jgi:rhodanese-related sulfurtransferase
MKPKTVTAAELIDLCQPGRNINLIDVRTPVEFQEVHLQATKNIPLDRLDAEAVAQCCRDAPGEPIYFICKSGSRGQKACEKMLAAGHSDAVNVEGGIEACVAAGVPAVYGKKAISLERQVRIAAGSLVLLGCALSFVHPAFIGLSAFVAAGLLFAGLTDTCGMAMLLARMPWNQCNITTPAAKVCATR